MKLIDILVRELPDLGGWPDGAEYCWQDWDKELRPGSQGFGFFINELAENHRKEGGNNPSPGDDNCITRQQYEAALAASKPEWDGEGLPPVGSKVSFFFNDRYNYNEEIIPQDGQELEVVAHKTTTDEHDVAVCYWDEDGGGMAVCLVPGSLRTIRSEADKRREIGVLSLARADPTVGRFEYGEKMSDGRLIGYAWYELYDKIAAGEVAGIRID